MRILLASSSPRRRELLERAGLVFQVAASPAEEIHDETMEPWRLCEENALLKARAVAPDHPEETIIGADTLVFSDGRALGKPRDMEEARAMLRALSGKTHRVCTGVCLIFPGGVEEVFHDLTEVIFREFGDDVIGEYFAEVNPLDKAGAYGIQEHGEMLVSEIRGSFENVMGLPVGMVVERLMSSSPGLRTTEG
ncbi:Maf family protein [Luteolibacter sp. SL250]|uniref:Maf family protein n=1 Tax=Luteolibacter sp. SL250 TaxID=2995170 RepID=UPI00226E4080|nr:Maf family protein [Luteolibacter sp. SL250]WAC19480.1 Maf family protein [Luteolibacter sp. SL250]